MFGLFLQFQNRILHVVLLLDICFLVFEVLLVLKYACRTTDAAFCSTRDVAVPMRDPLYKDSRLNRTTGNWRRDSFALRYGVLDACLPTSQGYSVCTLGPPTATATITAAYLGSSPRIVGACVPDIDCRVDQGVSSRLCRRHGWATPRTFLSLRSTHLGWSRLAFLDRSHNSSCEMCRIIPM